MTCEKYPIGLIDAVAVQQAIRGKTGDLNRLLLCLVQHIWASTSDCLLEISTNIFI